MAGFDFTRLPSIARGGLLIYLVINLLTTILSGALTFIQTGDPIPLLDNTVGFILAGDNKASALVKDLSTDKFSQVPEEYRQIVKDSAIRLIFTNILINLLVLYFLFKLVHFFAEWNADRGAKGVIFALIGTGIIYFVTSILYYILVLNKGEELTVDATLSAGIPLKTVYYLVKLIIETPGVLL